MDRNLEIGGRVVPGLIQRMIDDRSIGSLNATPGWRQIGSILGEFFAHIEDMQMELESLASLILGQGDRPGLVKQPSAMFGPPVDTTNPPGNIDVAKYLPLGVLDTDMPFGLDYRTAPPRVIALVWRDDKPNGWVTLSESLPRFLGELHSPPQDWTAVVRSRNSRHTARLKLNNS